MGGLFSRASDSDEVVDVHRPHTRAFEMPEETIEDLENVSVLTSLCADEYLTTKSKVIHAYIAYTALCCCTPCVA